MQDNEYWTVQQVADHLGVSTRTIYRCVKEGSLKKPIKIGKRASRWPKSEIVINKFSRHLNDAPKKKKN